MSLGFMVGRMAAVFPQPFWITTIDSWTELRVRYPCALVKYQALLGTYISFIIWILTSF